MLILSRYPGEQIVITVPPGTEPQTIIVEAVDVRGGGVRIGFEAEKEVTINRAEIQAAKERQESK